jgi:hypothetical protein
MTKLTMIGTVVIITMTLNKWMDKTVGMSVSYLSAINAISLMPVGAELASAVQIFLIFKGNLGTLFFRSFQSEMIITDPKNVPSGKWVL